MAQGRKIITALIIVITAILIVFAASYYYRMVYHTYLVSGAADGATVALQCQKGQAVKVVWATYTPVGGSGADVAVELQAALAASSGGSFVVSAGALGQPAGGLLSFRYRCAAPPSGRAADGFRPVPITTCGSPYDDHYAVDMSSRNAAGTVVWDPYSTQSRVSLERGAESPEVAEALNPITGIGKDSSVRAMSDRYRRGEALNRISIYEYQPGEPGFMEEVGDGAMSLMAKVSRRSPGTSAPAPSCRITGSDTFTDFLTDGPFDNDRLPGGGPPRDAMKESLTSRRPAHPNTLTAAKTGLGSVRLDPRFEPGPETRVPGGDASWAHGGHAGGPTSGGFGSTRFVPGNTWDWNYVFGAGDDIIEGCQLPVEAIETERSMW